MFGPVARAFLACVCVWSVVGCADGDDAPDAALTDARPTPRDATAEDAALDASAPDAEPVDADAEDATSTDARVEDAAVRDATPMDAGAADAEPSDAMLEDAAPRDATAADATAPDARVLDASAPDVGLRDSGPVDGGPTPMECAPLGDPCMSQADCPGMECGPFNFCIPRIVDCGGFVMAMCPTQWPVCMYYTGSDFGPCLTTYEAACLCNHPTASRSFPACRGP